MHLDCKGNDAFRMLNDDELFKTSRLLLRKLKSNCAERLISFQLLFPFILLNDVKLRLRQTSR